LPFALTLYFASLVGPVVAGPPIAAALPWVPSLGATLAFRVDGLGLLFALLICGVGGLIMLYAGAYLGPHPQLGRFFLFLLAFMASMLGLVLVDNVLALFVFWELTSVTSFLLLGVAVFFGQLDITVRAGLIVGFIFLTAPVSAHVVARAAYAAGVPLREGTIADELGQHYKQRAGAAADEPPDDR
jgi:monovalent cation/proton antiporter MnhG/PhaG subunit